MAEILIMTGKVKSGKTTRLMQWSINQKNIDGIFQPLIEDKRFLYHISSRTLKPLETDRNKNIITIGNYKFLNESFEWAKKILRKCIDEPLDYFIIDEVGPLELEGKGLEPAISELIKNEKKFVGKIIFVVRESLLEKFINHYHIEEKYKIFEM